MEYMEPRIDLDQALDILNRLRAAAPGNTAAKLAQVTALLKQLSDENTYLNSLVLDNIPALSEPLQPVPRAVSDIPIDDYTDYANLMDTDPYPENHYDDETSIADTLPPVEALPLFNGLSDSLRPPLVAIRGRAELVQGGLLGQITPEQDTWLEAIQENTRRAFAVLDALWGHRQPPVLPASASCAVSFHLNSRPSAFIIA